MRNTTRREASARATTSSRRRSHCEINTRSPVSLRQVAAGGPVVLSGDLYHFPAERTFGKMPSGEAERGQTAVSRQRLEEFIKINKAQLWIQHDMVGYRRSVSYTHLRAHETPE